MSITVEQVLTMDYAAIVAAIKNPETKDEMQNILRNRKVADHVSNTLLEHKKQLEARESNVDAETAVTVPPTTEELAAQAQTMVAAPETPVAPATSALDFSSEDADFAAEGIRVTRDTTGRITRLVQEYQVFEDGTQTPIGRPTHLEARSVPELFAKQRVAHTNAVQAFHRLKKQKMTFKQEQRTVLTDEQLAEAASIAIAEASKEKAIEVVKATIESQYKKADQELLQQKEHERGREIANEFMRRHLHDYNPCDANKKAFTEYFTVEHPELEFTVDNLEVAFLDLQEPTQAHPQGRLVPVTKPVVAQPNPQPTASVVSQPVVESQPSAAPITEPTSVAPPAAAPSQPAVEQPTPTPAAPNQQPPARRPGVNGSLPPGSLSAQRPAATDPTLTRKEFLKDFTSQKPEEMKRRIKDPQYAAKLRSYGVKV